MDGLAHPLGIPVIEQLSPPVDDIDIGAVAVEVLAEQAVEDAPFAQIDAAADIAEVTPVGGDDRLRDHHHQLAGGGDERCADQWLALFQGLPGPRGVEQAPGRKQHRWGNGQQREVVTHDVGGVEGVGLLLESFRFRSQLLRLLEEGGQSRCAIGQLLARGGEQALGAFRQFGRIHAVGFQGLLDQQVALYLIADVEAVDQGEQGGGDAQQQDQAAQIDSEHGREAHVATPKNSVM
ncbi:hypothetical protein D3C78_960550 [compost metagenome]